MMEQVETMPVTAEKIRQRTGSDPFFARLRDYVRNGSPDMNSSEIKPYFTRKTELSLLDGFYCGTGGLLFHHKLENVFSAISMTAILVLAE